MPEESYRHFLDPDDMTVEEQEQRVINLIASACVRIADRANKKGDLPTEKELDFPAKEVYPSVLTGDASP